MWKARKASNTANQQQEQLRGGSSGGSNNSSGAAATTTAASARFVTTTSPHTYCRMVLDACLVAFVHCLALVHLQALPPVPAVPCRGVYTLQTGPSGPRSFLHRAAPGSPAPAMHVLTYPRCVVGAQGLVDTESCRCQQQPQVDLLWCSACPWWH